MGRGKLSRIHDQFKVEPPLLCERTWSALCARFPSTKRDAESYKSKKWGKVWRSPNNIRDVPKVKTASLALLVAASINAYGGQEPLLACGSDSEQPPFSFFERKSGAKTNNVVGVTVDVIKAIGAKLGNQIKIELLPWKRCISYVESGKYDIAIDNRVEVNASSSDPLIHSERYYHMHPSYVYYRSAKPAGFDIKSAEILATQKVCGLPGRRYDAFGVKENQIDMGISSYVSNFSKLKSGRCDIFIEYRELLAGLYLVDSAMSKVITDKDIVMKPLPNSKETGLVFSVNRKSELLPKINAVIAELVKQEKMDSFLEPYFR